jgi:hypothetical protein
MSTRLITWMIPSDRDEELLPALLAFDSERANDLLDNVNRI